MKGKEVTIQSMKYDEKRKEFVPGSEKKIKMQSLIDTGKIVPTNSIASQKAKLEKQYNGKESTKQETESKNKEDKIDYSKFR